MTPRLRARIGLGLLSVAGTCAGHFLSYWVAAPDPHHRAELLEATGHAGESPFLVIAVAALLATCIAALSGRASQRAPRFWVALGGLVALQTTAFVGLEMVERIGAHAPLLESVQEPVFVLGLVAQVVVALLGALIIRTLHVAASSVAVHPPTRSFVVALVPADGHRIPSSHPYRPGDPRGPPFSS